MGKEKAGDKQITFRVPGRLHERLQATADTLGTDISHLLRIMITKHLPAYEAEADDIRQKEPKKGSKS